MLCMLSCRARVQVPSHFKCYLVPTNEITGPNAKFQQRKQLDCASLFSSNEGNFADTPSRRF